MEAQDMLLVRNAAYALRQELKICIKTEAQIMLVEGAQHMLVDMSGTYDPRQVLNICS